MKNIYLVTRKDKVDYDEYNAMVVAASSEDEAIKIHPGSGFSKYSGTWVLLRDIGKLDVELIGVAAEGQDGLILASFNAG